MELDALPSLGGNDAKGADEVAHKVKVFTCNIQYRRRGTIGRLQEGNCICRRSRPIFRLDLTSKNCRCQTSNPTQKVGCSDGSAAAPPTHLL